MIMTKVNQLEGCEKRSIKMHVSYFSCACDTVRDLLLSGLLMICDVLERDVNGGV